MTESSLGLEYLEALNTLASSVLEKAPETNEEAKSIFFLVEYIILPFKSTNNRSLYLYSSINF